jgi:hypothetical protein
VYGINLSAPEMTLTELADHVSWLPPGCALYMDMGGPASLSMESEQLRWIDYRLRVLAYMQTKDAKDGRNPPSQPEPIKYRRERVAESEAESAKASAWARRQAIRARAGATAPPP